jgi:hypothetical protein
LWVFPEAKTTANKKGIKIQARPQATVGLSLDAIQKYGTIKEQQRSEGKGYTKTGPTETRRSNTLKTYSSTFENIAKKAAKEIGNEKLSGFATLLALYVYIFHDPTGGKDDYAKGVMPLLAKTNFAYMFGKLDQAERDQYSQNPDQFVNLILNLVNSQQSATNKVTEDKPVMVQKRFNKSLGNEGNLLLKTWLEGITQGVDNLTEKHYSNLFGFGNLKSLKEKGEDVGSGAKADPGQKMVLEFRGGSQGRGGFLPSEEWRDFVYDYFLLVRQLHGRKDIAPWPKT